MAEMTAAQKAVLFAQGTRQNWHTLGKKTAGAGESISFVLPKARLLSNIFLDFSFKIGGLTTASDVSFNASELIEKIELNLNNGFTPFSLSGKALEMLNSTETIWKNGDGSHVSSAKFKNTLTDTADFMLYLRNALNDRDTVSYILLQNDTTYAELTVYLKSNPLPIMGATAMKTFECSVTPTLETFTIPTTGLPDLSVLKLVHSRNQMYDSGRSEIKMSTGTIYRKIILAFPADTELDGNIELVFNQADINYSISPNMLSQIAAMRGNDVKYPMSKGRTCYVVDLSYQGVLNMGGTRDYIDSEKLTEFSIRFNAKTAGTCEIITETLARLS